MFLKTILQNNALQDLDRFYLDFVLYRKSQWSKISKYTHDHPATVVGQ